MTRIPRAMVRYYGGKHALAPWIVSQLPAHQVYVEPFGGAASVLLRKERSSVEVLADLDPRLFSLYRTLADSVLSRQLAWNAFLTPYRRSVYADLSRHPEPEDDLGRALRMLVRGGMGMSSSDGSGFRGHRARPDGTTMQGDWASYRRTVPALHARLAGVVIRHADAFDVMREHDGPDTLHYVDPPYVPSTRGRHGYRHDLDLDGHVRLVELLRSLRGMVVLSGYAAPVYDTGLVGWTRIDRTALDNSRTRRTESLWLNPAAVEASTASVRQLSLF